MRRLIGVGFTVAMGLCGCLPRRVSPLLRYVVADQSMAPGLLPGDRLLVRRLWASEPRVGDVLVVRDPREPGRALVKRLARVEFERQMPASPRYWLVGDNRAASRDSRTFGPLGRGAIVGRVVWRYLPGHRRGSVA